MNVNASANSIPWPDRGRWWMFIAIALTIVPAAYVIATAQVTTPLLPAMASIACLVAHSRRSAVALRATALVIMFLFMWLGMASVGIFFAPGVVAMFISVVRTDIASAN